MPDNVDKMMVNDEDIFAVVKDRYPAQDHEDCPLNEGVPLVGWPSLCVALVSRSLSSLLCCLSLIVC